MGWSARRRRRRRLGWTRVHRPANGCRGATPRRRWGERTPSARRGLQALYDFTFDDDQRRARLARTRAMECWWPLRTGSGKTVDLALAAGRKCFYTTPIKALLNSKFGDLVRRYGPVPGRPATGYSINGEAPVWAITTEVLRNSSTAGWSPWSCSPTVVLDEGTTVRGAWKRRSSLYRSSAVRDGEHARRPRRWLTRSAGPRCTASTSTGHAADGTSDHLVGVA